MIKVLFICHGNICRSPMSEYVLKDMVERKGLTEQFEIASAATSTEEIWNGKGNPIYPPAQEELRRHGIGNTSSSVFLSFFVFSLLCILFFFDTIFTFLQHLFQKIYTTYYRNDNIDLHSLSSILLEPLIYNKSAIII